MRFKFNWLCLPRCSETTPVWLVSTLTQTDLDQYYSGLSLRSVSYLTNVAYTILNGQETISTAPIYECIWQRFIFFISRSIDCEIDKYKGSVKIRLAGYIYTSNLENTVALYRCKFNPISMGFWVTNNETECKTSKSKMEVILGYVKINNKLD